MSHEQLNSLVKLQETDDEETALSRMASVYQPQGTAEYTVREYLHVPYLPLLRRRPRYSWEHLRGDVLAGLVAVVVAIPQGLAYAVLAGLPPVVGLYTSAIPPLIYAVLGTSNTCSIGPNALVAMFIPHLVTDWKHQYEPIYVLARSSLAALVVGAVNLFIGLARLGGLVRFISGPVLMGFNNGAAVVIFISQLPNILAFRVPGFSYNFQQYIYLASVIFKESSVVGLAIGVFVIVFLHICRWLKIRYPGKATHTFNTCSTLLAAVITTLAARSLVLAGVDVSILGHVPKGLPRFALPSLAFDGLKELGDVISSCIPVALLAFMSLWSVAKKYAEIQNQTDVDPNQEAFAIGATNLIAGFFSCFPTAASFSRSALNAQTGARSPLSNLFVGLVVFVCLLALTPLLYYLPMACLGGIINFAMTCMFDLSPAYKAYKVARTEFIVMVASFLSTVFINIEVGLVLGIMASIAVLLTELSQIQHTEMVPVALAFPDLEKHQHMVKCVNQYMGVRLRGPVERTTILAVAYSSCMLQVIRLTCNLFFGNSEGLKEKFFEIINAEPRLRVVVVDAAGISLADLSGLEALDEMHEAAKAKGMRLIIVHSHAGFRDRLKATGLFDKLEQSRFQHMRTVDVVKKLLVELTVETIGMQHGGHKNGQPKQDGDGEEKSLILEKNAYGSV